MNLGNLFLPFIRSSFIIKDDNNEGRTPNDSFIATGANANFFKSRCLFGECLLLYLEGETAENSESACSGNILICPSSPGEITLPGTLSGTRLN